MSARVLPLLVLLTACGPSAPVEVTWTLLSDSTGDERLNAGERVEYEVQVEATSSEPIGLDEVEFIATVSAASGPVIDGYTGDEVDEVTCTGTGNLALMFASCTVYFDTLWLDAAAEDGELTLSVDVKDADEPIYDETSTLDLVPMRAEPKVTGVAVVRDSNSDGACSPGESCELNLLVANDGRDALFESDISVVSTSPDLSLEGGASGNLWTIEPGDSKEHLVYVSVDPAAASGTPLGLEARFVDSLGNAWTDAVQLPVVGPDVELQVSAARVSSGDGTLQAGSSFDLDVTVENLGGSQAYELSGILSASSEHVDISTSSANYWTIDSGDSKTQTFYGRLAEETPAGAALEFFLTLEDGFGNIYTDSFTLVEGSSGVALVLEDTTFTEVSGDGDGSVEAGEAWYVDLTVGNAGAVLASEVSVNLSTDSSHISFSDSSEALGDINPGRSASSDRGFRFTVLGSHPGGDTPVDVELRSGSVTVETTFSIPVE